MSIANEISRLQQAKADIKTAIEAKGVTVPSSAKLDSYDDYIGQISGGGSVPTFLGWMPKSDIVQFLDVDGDGMANIADLTVMIENYNPSSANDCYQGNASAVDALISQGPTSGNKKGYEMIGGDLENMSGLSAPFFVRLASVGGERWAIVDFSSYIYAGELQYSYYAVYDGKPNLSLMGAK